MTMVIISTQPVRRDHSPGKDIGVGSGRTIRTLMLAATLMSPGVGLAAEAGSSDGTVPAVTSDTLRTFDIPAQTLGSALTLFGRQAGLQLAVDTALLVDQRSNSVRGSLTTAAAIGLLLGGTDLIGRVDSGVLLITRFPQAAQQLTSAARPLLSRPTVAVAPDPAIEEVNVIGIVPNSYVGPWSGRSLQDTPYSLSVISADLIKSMQARNADQIFRVNPTTQLYRSQAQNDQPSVNLRGFGQSVSYLNGMPSGQYGQGIATEDVERIEILTGLSGFLYGPGNVGGLVNYVSKAPTSQRLAEITAGNDGGDNYYTHVDLGGPIDAAGKFGYRVNAVVQDGETVLENQHVDRKFLSTALDWRVSDTVLLQFNAARRRYTVTGQAYFQFAPGVKRPAASTIDTSRSFGQPWQKITHDNDRIGVRLAWKASDALTFRAGLNRDFGYETGGSSFNMLNGDGTYDQTLDLFPVGVSDMLTDKRDTRAMAFADFQFQTGAFTHKLTAGWQASNNVQSRFNGEGAVSVTYSGLDLGHNNFIPRPANLPPVNRGAAYTVIDTTTTSFMLGDDITFNEQWSLLLGVARSAISYDRYAWGGLYDEAATTPTVSLIYKPLPWLTTYGSYIESLEQGGQAGERFNGFVVVNAGEVFKPLGSEQVELGLKATAGRMLLTTALFEIDKGLQYYDVSIPTGPRYVQDGRQVHRGIEVTATGNLSDNLTLISGFTLLDAGIEQQKQTPALEGKTPRDVSDRFAKLRLEYAVHGLPALTLIGGVQYYSDRFADAANTDRLGSYAIADIGARYSASIADKPLTLRLEVRNAGDRHYWIWGGLGSLGEPRTVVFSANLQL